jgi:hypothetical protein
MAKRLKKKPGNRKGSSPSPTHSRSAAKGTPFRKVAVTPQLAKLGAALASGNAVAATQIAVEVAGNMSGGDLYIVKIDGIKVGMTNDRGSKTVSPGDHWLTTDLVGDVGSTVTVTATVDEKQVAACTCAVVNGSNPPRHADCADDFTV